MKHVPTYHIFQNKNYYKTKTRSSGIMQKVPCNVQQLIQHTNAYFHYFIIYFTYLIHAQTIICYKDLLLLLKNKHIHLYSDTDKYIIHIIA